MTVNSAVIVGRLTRDPEPIWTANGTCVLEFAVAVDNPVKTADGSWGSEPSFIECVLFGARAEKLSEIMHKGMKVTVQGRLQQQRWQNKQGENRSKVRILTDNVELPPRSTSPASTGAPTASAQPSYGGQGGYVSPQAQVDPFAAVGGTVIDDAPF